MTSTARANHVCSTYCDGDVHCDLVYVGAHEASTGHARSISVETACRQAAICYWENGGAYVVRSEPATEAPPIGAWHHGSLHVLVGDPSNQTGEHRLLIYWRDRGETHQPPWYSTTTQSHQEAT